MVNKPLTGISKIYLKFRSALIHSSILGNHTIDFPESNTSEYFWDLGSNSVKEVFNKLSHTYPVVYLGAQARGAIKEQKISVPFH